MTVRESDFAGWSLGTRFYPLLYLLTRVWGARDWGNGNALSKHLLSQSNSLQLHHVFPKAYLYRNGYDKAEANALANFALLTAKTNQELSDRPPHEYFEEVEKRQPGALESQWIPMSLADEPAWLSSVAGVPREDLADELTKLAERGRADRLVFTRWPLVMYRFEKALYEDPDRADLGVLWWDLIERLQIQERPPGREGAPDWAAKVHLSVAPVYYHNYLLGHMFAAQLRNYLETRVSDGPFFQDEMAGRYLQEAVLGPGARNAWGEIVLGATGERLDPEHFVASFRR